MKVQFQSESSECGLAALAMTISAYGLNIDLPELRRLYPLSLKGAKLSHVVKMAQDLGFQTRALRIELDDLSKLKIPCILHYDLNHFVVLEKVAASKVTIIDPAMGKRILSISEFSDHFTGIALELTPSSGFTPRKASPSVSVKQLTGDVRGLWPALSQIFLLSIALQAFVILAPFYLQWVVDHALISADKNLLTVLGLGFGLTLLLQVGIGLLRGWSVVYLSSLLALQWMGNVFAHTVRLPLDFFEKRHLGDVTSRLASLQVIQKTLTTNFIEAVIDGLMAVVTFGLMLFYSWKLALITLFSVGLYSAIRALSFQPIRNQTEQQLMNAARQETYLLETLRGMQSVKVAGLESQRRSVYQNLMTETINSDVSLARLGLGFNVISQLVFGIERIAVIWIGALLAIQNIFSVGMLIAYLAYKDQFATRMSSLIDKWVDFRMLRLHGERLADIALTSPEEGYGLPEVEVPDSIAVEVEALGFRYSEGEPWTLKDCSFRIENGESVAIVGVSGSGKTTLVKLMLGLLKPSEGHIHIGGFDIHKVGARNLRSMMGVVMQDDQLLAGSIAENIGLFDSGVDPTRIAQAATLAGIHDEIMAMPMGYHSLIGDMGNSLSGGQKQRILLARALYRNPRLLILDEATSHLDVARERWVNEAVKHLKLTKIIVAHRPETIASADRVLVIEDGRIARDFKPVAPTQVVGPSA